MAGSRSPSKQTKQRVPTIRRREVGGAIQLKGISIGPEQVVICGLPSGLSPTNAEIALWRAFLADEIEAILLDGE
jgi:hypothetical protein